MRINLKTLGLCIVSAACCLIISINSAYSAVGCTLNDPDRDIKRIFPEATGFKTEFLSIAENGGKELETRLEDLLEEKLDPVYETSDVPYAFYTVLKAKKTIGHVHGVNQKGKYGGMQIIIATDTEGVVVDFYFQKISSPEARAFRNKSFTDQFKKLTPGDGYRHKMLSAEKRKESKIGEIKDPTKKSQEDFEASIRGTIKNLFLLDEFKLEKKYNKLAEKEKGAPISEK